MKEATITGAESKSHQKPTPLRILYIDIDSLRPDHLGCYGYHRNTSPNIDRLAAGGIRFENVYVSDAPCLPSRTALSSGQFGFHTGVVNHGGTAAQPFVRQDRSWTDEFHDSGWMMMLRRAGFTTATVSSFAERHAAWHWYAGYSEIMNPGKEGMDRADEVTPLALDWLDRNGAGDDWFLHVNFWDPHIPYRTPLEYGDPFEDDPLPEWMTEDVWRRGWEGYGPHSPQEPHGFGGEEFFLGYPRFPESIDSMEAVKRWFDGYDTGIRYTDDYLGEILNKLSDLNVLDETSVIISADHGESQGEFNIWGDHQTADHTTCRVPLIVRWPGRKAAGEVDAELRYHVDWAATLVEVAGGSLPDNWDGRSFQSFDGRRGDGRPYLVVSQGAHICQRGVRFEADEQSYMCLWTLNPGYKMIEPLMLFNLDRDPHEQSDISDQSPELTNLAMRYLAEWHRDMMRTSRNAVDPMMISLREGPLHARGMLDTYAERLRATGRVEHVPALMERHTG